MARYKLKLKQLDFVSLVDDPAQPNAKCLLIKRRGNADEVSATARLVKTSDELGLAFFWAFTTTETDGSEHFDLHGDQVLSDNDMIKAAAEFMEKGGAVDEMHDSEKTGRVVFAMPMTPEIAKAFGVETKTSGLMIALRPSADAMAKLKSGEYRAVSIAGLGERIEARKAAKVAKSSLATDEVDGHAHALRIYEDGTMWVESATMAGSEYSHSHGLITNADGSLSILADSGHTHQIQGAAVIAVPADAVVVVQNAVSPTTNGNTLTLTHAKSTRSAAPPHGDDMKLIVLTEAQHAHYSKLATADAEAFIAKSSAERDAVLADIAKADSIVFKGELTGIEVRKSQGEFALKLAQSAEASEKRAQDAAKSAEVEKAARELTELKKRAAETMPNLAGSDDVHCAILKAVESIADEKVRGEAITALKAANDAAKARAVAKGFGGTDPADAGPQAELDALIAAETAKGVEKSKATTNVMNTAKGQQLYADIQKAKKAARA